MRVYGWAGIYGTACGLAAAAATDAAATGRTGWAAGFAAWTAAAAPVYFALHRHDLRDLADDPGG